MMWTRLWLWILTRLGRDPRGLFVFFDGRRWRAVDPLSVARQLFTHAEFDWDETPQLLLTGQSLMQLEAFRVIGEAVRTAFAVRAVSAGGLSDRECLELLTAFRTYLGDVKKNGSLFPISQDSMESPSADRCDMKPESDCGSTCTGACSERPGSAAAGTTSC